MAEQSDMRKSKYKYISMPRDFALAKTICQAQALPERAAVNSCFLKHLAKLKFC